MAISVLIPAALLAADPKDFLPLLYLCAAVIVGALLIALASRWRRGVSGGALSPSASDQLAQYRVLYEKGAISEEEYKRLRALLGGELRKTLDLPARPEAAPGLVSPPPGGDPPATGIRPS